MHWPWFLPDGKRFLYTARLDDGEGEVRLAQLRLDDREGNARPVQLEGGTRTVMSASSNAQWVDPDVVVFAREGVLMGQRVDVEAARPLGEPFPIAERVDVLLHHVPGDVQRFPDRHRRVPLRRRTCGQLVWADRNGNEVGTIGSPADYQPDSARLSRDDSALLTARSRAGLGTYDIWRHEPRSRDRTSSSLRTAAAS